MKLLDKKFMPFYIIGATIIIICIIMSIIIAKYPPSKNEEKTTEPITEAPTNPDMDGIPYYDIPASIYQDKYFAYDENNRIIYTDDSVPYYTGVDVSQFQGDIDWEEVAQDGIDFAIIRVGLRYYGSTGAIDIDDCARQNIENALDAGLKIGVYFFSQAISVEEAVAEAEFVIEQLKGYRIDYPVVFDWENEPDKNMRTDVVDDETLTYCAVAFCETIKKAGYTPAVYFNLNFGYLRYNLDLIKNYVFWYAQFDGISPEFYYKYSMWQYTDSGKVQGIDADVDLNISFIDF